MTTIKEAGLALLAGAFVTIGVTSLLPEESIKAGIRKADAGLLAFGETSYDPDSGTLRSGGFSPFKRALETQYSDPEYPTDIYFCEKPGVPTKICLRCDCVTYVLYTDTGWELVDNTKVPK